MLGPKRAVAVSGTPARPPALLTIVSVALLAPMVVGVNVTDAVVVAPAASVTVPGAPTENCAASVPVIASGVASVTGKPLRLVMVSCSDPCEPRNAVPRSSGDGVPVIVAATIDTEYEDVAKQPRVSVACTVKLNVAATDGVPKRTPAGEKVSPVGGAPAVMEKV